MFLSSLQTFVLFDRKCPAKWTSQDIPPSFQFEASVYVPFKGHWSVRDVNLNWIYLQRYICHTSLVSFVCVWWRWRSANPWINQWINKFRSEVNVNGFSCLGSREQWTLCREHVNRNTVHSWNFLLMSWWSESGVFKQQRHAKCAERGGARTGVENRCSRLTQKFLKRILMLLTLACI